MQRPTPPGIPAAPPASGTVVALVEDDCVVRQRLARLLEDAPGVSLAAALDSAGDAIAWLAEHPVHVLLVDLGLPDGSGIDVIRACKHQQPACEVMVVTMFGDEHNMIKAFEAGATGYLLKDGSEQDLAAHVADLRNGGTPMSPIIARQLLRRLRPATDASPPHEEAAPACPLSPKEQEVLALVARGFSYAEVGRLMDIKVNTVHTHARNIYGKLNVNSKTEAVWEARQQGWLPP